MKVSKEYNEYGDKLVTLEIALTAKEVDYDNHSPECLAILRTPGKEPIITDEWSGLIPEPFEYLCDRPTQSTLQKWLREKHDIQVYCKPYKGNKWSVYADIEGHHLITEYIYTDYELGLEKAIQIALEYIIKNK